ncbi:hypothetical protein GpartN1_g2929.t1 [Galdieria partita]|uniref:DNA-directed RNA polymerase III subunit RPC8 n=1 Tax=Galdieria partita TaxID=83374 RepID=A0A9C7UPR2_9RHOD|nr:hypothetical protein GpartN1_g2929.t1 [Galdieria partita]
MFKLAILEDTLRISPERFSLPKFDALSYTVHKKYSNRVLPGVGLCIGLWDWLKSEEDYLQPGDGGSWTKVTFRLLVFEPQVGEIIIGRVEHSFSEGLYVSLDFFNNIFIDRLALQEPSIFDEEEQVWIWKYQGHDLHIDVGEDIRFRVVKVAYDNFGKSNVSTGAMIVNGSIAGDGLGLVSWWPN